MIGLEMIFLLSDLHSSAWSPPAPFFKTMNLYYFCNLKKKKKSFFGEEKGDNRAKLPKTKSKINQTWVEIPPLLLTICAPGQKI